MAAAKSAPAAKAAAPAKPAPAKAAPAPAASADPGSSATPSVPSAQPGRVASPPPPAEDKAPTPGDQVKAEKLDFAERMKRAKQRIKTRGAKATPSADEPAKQEPASGGEPEDNQSNAAASGKSPRELLEAGDLDAAFEAAFGKKTRDFKIDARRWEEWRKAQLRGKRELAAKREAGEAEIKRLESDFAKRLEHAEREYGPLIKGLKAYKAGDIVEAVKLWTGGDDLNTFQKKALAQYHGKNPEVEALRRELAERDRKATEAERERQERAAQAERERKAEANRTYVRESLTKGSDEQLKRLAADPAFVERTLQVLLEQYDEDEQTTIPVAEAADMVRHDIIRRFGGVFGAPADRSVSAESDQGGSNPANAESGKKPRTRTLSQRGAVEASEPGRPLTDRERIAKYTALAKAQRAANA